VTQLESAYRIRARRRSRGIVDNLGLEIANGARLALARKAGALTSGLGLLLSISVLFLTADMASAQPKLVITFFDQDGGGPTSIQMKGAGEAPPIELKGFSGSNNWLTLTANDFSAPLETFTVTVNYTAPQDKVEFDLRMMMPLTDSERKTVYLYKPKKSRTKTATDEAIEDLDDDQKGYGSYFVCRQMYYLAEKNGDPKTQLNAALCWVTANARLVFAHPPAAARLYSPDLSAIAVAEKVLSKPEDQDIEASEREAWQAALNARAKRFKKLETVRDDILRLKLALWHFFPRRHELRKIHGRESYCKLMAMFRQQLPEFKEKDRERLASLPFAVKQSDIDALQPVTLADTSSEVCSQSS
jgi:hypothetical protein